MKRNAKLEMTILGLAFAAGVALMLSGCATGPITHGIPNFHEIAPGVYRGGQPTAEGWEWLTQQGTQYDVKLNTWDESPDAPWSNPVEMWCDYEPITLEVQLGIDRNTYPIDSALQSLIDHPQRFFVHCEHGQDRTGLLVACYRVRFQHWTKADAEKEMLANGFHKELRGLWEYWKRWNL